MQINEKLILTVMSNPHAAQIVNHDGDIRRRTHYMWRSPHSTIPIEEYVKIFGFNEKEVAAILYAREVKRRYNFQFNQIVSGHELSEKCTYMEQLNSITIDQICEFVKSSPKLVGDLKSEFPTLPIYTVPGEKTSELEFTYVALYPSWYDNEIDYGLINQMGIHGMAGAHVIRLSMNLPDAKLLFALAKSKKIEAIICYYDGGGRCYNWNWVMNSLFDNQNRTKAEAVFHKIAKNKNPHSGVDEGIDNDFLETIAKTYVRRTRVRENV